LIHGEFHDRFELRKLSECWSNGLNCYRNELIDLSCYNCCLNHSLNAFGSASENVYCFDPICDVASEFLSVFGLVRLDDVETTCDTANGNGYAFELANGFDDAESAFEREIGFSNGCEV
jgi:hypothetical protein